MKINFGMHEGHEISELPSQYLEWVLTKAVGILLPAMKKEIESVLEKRTESEES